MAIQIYCVECRNSCSLDSKKCSKCGKAFGRDRKYRVSVSVKGKRQNRIVDNLTIAREVEGALKGDMVRDEFEIADHRTQDRPVTLADVWERYLPLAQSEKKTWKCDQYNYETHLAPRFASKPLENIALFDIQRMKREMRAAKNKQGRPFTDATIKHQLVLLRHLFTLAKKWRIFKGENPVDPDEIPKLDNEKTERLSDEQAARLMNVLDTWPCKETVTFIRFAMYTGTRRGELFKLAWDDIDLERGTITLRAPKGGKTTTIPVSDSALDVLRGTPVTSKYVFPGKGGEQRTDFKKPWQKIRKAAGLPADFRFHGLRHHFASSLVDNGVDLYTVQKLLTHKDSRTTQRYAHLSDKTTREAAQKSGELLTQKNGQVLSIVK